MLKVVIISIEGKPEIEVDQDLTPRQIARLVSRQFGYKGIHLPHSWLAFKS